MCVGIKIAEQMSAAFIPRPKFRHRKSRCFFCISKENPTFFYQFLSIGKKNEWQRIVRCHSTEEQKIKFHGRRETGTAPPSALFFANIQCRSPVRQAKNNFL